MLFKIAWRNIGRNSLRSGVVIGSIVLGIWAIIFLVSMVFGMVDSYINNAIKNDVTHIQIMHPKFPEDQEIQYFIEDAQEKASIIRKIGGVSSVSARFQSNAMISSSRSAMGIQLLAVDPINEKISSGIPSTIIEGDYLDTKKSNPLLISFALAEKLQVKMRSKLVLTFQDYELNMTSAAFRVSGIFDSKNNIFDKSHAVIDYQDFSRISGMESKASKLTLFVDNLDQIDTIKTQIKALFPNLLVQDYEEVSPDLALFKNQINIASTIYIFIFMLALIFGIINTMLMAVLERFKELGMLMSIGMNRWSLFRMIVIETLMLAAIGMPIGIAIGYFSTTYFHKHGINLFFYSDNGMEQFGLTKFIYPTVTPEIYFQLASAVAITAFLASLYPAYKAIKVKPIEALRKL